MWYVGLTHGLTQGSDVHYLRHGAIGEFILKSPMILGHESSGEIVSCAEDCNQRQVGDRVAIEPGIPCRHCNYCREGLYNLCNSMSFAATPPVDGTLQKYYLVPEDFAHIIPDSMSFDEAALMEPLSVAVHVVKRLPLAFTSTCIIFGCGAIGLLCAKVARARGISRILMIDANESRMTFAKSYIDNVETYLPPAPAAGESKMEYSKRNAVGIAKISWLKEGASCVIDATGAEVCTQTAILSTRKNGYFIQAGMGPNDITIPIATICAREITVLGSFRYNEGCYGQAIALVASGLVDVKPLITHRYDFADAASAFETTGQAAQGTIKVIIRGQ